MFRQVPSIVLAAAMGYAVSDQAPPSSTSGAAPDQQFVVGPPLKLTPNAKTYGGFRFSESISYDAQRDLFVVVNAGMPRDVVPSDGYVSLANPDGTVHTLKWIGVNRNGLTLNHPLGSYIRNGLLYVADIDTVRRFDMKTGEPRGETVVKGVTRFNDLEVAEDGTVYATQTGDQNSETWRLYKITPQGDASILVSGAPLKRQTALLSIKRAILLS